MGHGAIIKLKVIIDYVLGLPVKIILKISENNRTTSEKENMKKIKLVFILFVY